jgi:hypothetical protein
MESPNTIESPTSDAGEPKRECGMLCHDFDKITIGSITRCECLRCGLVVEYDARDDE